MLSVLALAITLPAQTILAPFNVDYSYTDLGTVAGVTTNFGGLTFVPGQPNVMLLCGGSNGPSGQLFLVPLSRGAGGHITAFGAPQLVATAPYNDGGLCFGPGGVLFFTEYPVSVLGQIKPGSSAPDKSINLAPGVYGSPGACQFVPAGYPLAGHLKIASYSGGLWYDTTVVADGLGTYDLGAFGPGIQVNGGPEGILYPPAGSPGLNDYSQVIISEYQTGNIVLWDIDNNSDPVPGTRQVFMSGLTGAEGAALDPVTNDFLFSTYGGSNRIIQVRGFGTCGTFTNYGTGGPGTGGLIPGISGTGCPRLSQTVGIDLDNAVPNGFGILFFGTSQISVPFLNLTILTSLDVSVGIAADATGVATFPLFIPNSPSLGNLSFYWQGAFLDAGAPHAISATPGLQMYIQ